MQDEEDDCNKENRLGSNDVYVVRGRHNARLHARRDCQHLQVHTNRIRKVDAAVFAEQRQVCQACYPDRGEGT